MQTNELVTYISESAPDWPRASIVSLVNDVQNVMLCKELGQTLALDTTTGIDKKVTTVAGQYVYEVSTTATPVFDYNGWRVVTVFEDHDDDDNPEDEYNVDTMEATESAYAKFTFKEDPGGVDVYVRYYKMPTQITAETVQLSVPIKYHLNVAEGVIGLIEKSQSRNGKSERWDRFELRFLPEFWASMNKLTHVMRPSWQVPSRGY